MFLLFCTCWLPGSRAHTCCLPRYSKHTSTKPQHDTLCCRGTRRTRCSAWNPSLVDNSDFAQCGLFLSFLVATISQTESLGCHRRRRVGKLPAVPNPCGTSKVVWLISGEFSRLVQTYHQCSHFLNHKANNDIGFYNSDNYVLSMFIVHNIHGAYKAINMTGDLSWQTTQETINATSQLRAEMPHLQLHIQLTQDPPRNRTASGKSWEIISWTGREPTWVLLQKNILYHSTKDVTCFHFSFGCRKNTFLWTQNERDRAQQTNHHHRVCIPSRSCQQ